MYNICNIHTYTSYRLAQRFYNYFNVENDMAQMPMQ